MTFSDKPLCFYCSEYAKVAKDYSVNFASKDEDSFTPRCFLHWKYKCDKCDGLTHFNGISWCPSCKEFTCVSCTKEKMVRKEFLVYDYYYSISCHKCEKFNPALDFAEYDGKHPFQIGDLKPDEDVMVWIPISKEELESQEFPHKAWGSERVLSLGKRATFTRLASLKDYNPKSMWDAIAPHWLTAEEEDYHHKYKILPEVYRLLNVEKGDNILDVACGKGDLARGLVRRGARVTGIDISKMLNYAIKIEKKEKLGIKYLKLNAEKLTDKFESASFDKVVCSMALMDIEDFKATISNISCVLKENGIFVFSITHPAFAFPSCTSLRIPADSQRNEDKLRMVLDYFDERPAVLTFRIKSSRTLQSLVFQRPISSYLNELVKNNLVFREMSEPKASEELVKKFPRNAYFDDDMWPDFLIVKALKKSNI